MSMFTALGLGAGRGDGAPRQRGRRMRAAKGLAATARRWKVGVRGGCALISALAALAIAPAAGQASALGYEAWSAFTWNGISFPGGVITHEISGDGNHVSWDGANFVAAGTLCDSSMRFTYGGGTYEVRGGIHYGCSHVGQWKYSLNWNAPTGKACAELWAERWAKYIDKQCHYIHP